MPSHCKRRRHGQKDNELSRPQVVGDAYHRVDRNYAREDQENQPDEPLHPVGQTRPRAPVTTHGRIMSSRADDSN